MQLFEIKNDIAKILYTPQENHLLLADFLLIEDINQSLIAQIIDIESTDQSNTNVATVKFALSINKKSNLSTYNGYTPSKEANILHLDPKEIAQLIQSPQTNIFWGYLAAHSDTPINLGLSLLREKPCILCDKVENATVLATNVVYSLQENRKRTIIIDFDGRYKKIEDATRIVISKEYKLPLNFSAFDFISENDLEDCSTENKAMIQGILLELQSYVSTLSDKFIPFEIFKSVIDEQSKQNPIPELIIFKNKLIKYQQKGLFAQNKEQFNFLNKILSKSSITIIDASTIEEKWHRFIIETIASQIEKKCYFVANLTDSNSNKQTINIIYENENIRSIPFVEYKYKLVPQLKSLCKNLILFAPIEKTNDFEIYNSFLQKLNQKEFIIWSENTFYMPLILKLKALNKESFSKSVNEIKDDINQMLTFGTKTDSETPVLTSDEPIIQDKTFEFKEEYLDEGFIQIEVEEKNDIEEIQPEETIETPDFSDFQPIIDDVTDDDLDYLDNVKNFSVSENFESPFEKNEQPIKSEEENKIEQAEQVYIEPQVSIPTPAIEILTDEDNGEPSEPENDEDEGYIPPVLQPAIQHKEEVITEEKAHREQTLTVLEKTESAAIEQKIPSPPTLAPLPKKPSVPIYEVKIAEESKNKFKEGNFVYHAKYGKGVVEKIITYGNKTLCSIQFDNVGRRLLDPNLAEIQLV